MKSFLKNQCNIIFLYPFSFNVCYNMIYSWLIEYISSQNHKDQTLLINTLLRRYELYPSRIDHIVTTITWKEVLKKNPILWASISLLSTCYTWILMVAISPLPRPSCDLLLLCRVCYWTRCTCKVHTRTIQHCPIIIYASNLLTLSFIKSIERSWKVPLVFS